MVSFVSSRTSAWWWAQWWTPGPDLVHSTEGSERNPRSARFQIVWLCVQTARRAAPYWMWKQHPLFVTICLPLRVRDRRLYQGVPVDPWVWIRHLDSLLVLLPSFSFRQQIRAQWESGKPIIKHQLIITTRCLSIFFNPVLEPKITFKLLIYVSNNIRRKVRD